MVAMLQKMGEFYMIKDKVPASVAAEQAYNRMVRLQYSEVTNNYRVANGVDPATVRATTKEMDNAAVASDFKMFQSSKPNLTTAAEQQNDFRTAFQTGKWVSDPVHDGTAWFKVDPAGRRILQKNGQPYEFTSADMTDPTFLAKLNAKAAAAKKAKGSLGIGKQAQADLPTLLDIGRFIQETPTERIKRTGSLLAGAAKDVGKGAAALAEKAKSI